MAKKLYEETDVQDIATAIRSKNGASTKYKVSEMAAAINDISGDGTGSAELAAHIANKNNPHNVTAEQVGADTSGSAAAVQSNLNTHSGDTTKHITATERARWNSKQDALTFDSAPTAGSNNPITSGGVKEALKNLSTGTGGTDISLGLTSAAVGQIAKIKAVDSDGKPTEWESATIGSGGGSSGDAEAVQTNLDTHIADKNNPHQVTAAQVGALSSTPVDMLSDDGENYTCTVPWITELTKGACFIGIPKKTSTSSSVRLIVNDLVQKPLVITRSDSTGTFTYPSKDDWLRLNRPVRIMYIGSTWIVEGCARPIGEDVLGNVNSAKYAVGTNAVDTPALRNEYFVTTETTPTYNGQIAWVYG